MFVPVLMLAVLAASASSSEIVKEVGEEPSRVIFCPATFGFCRGPAEYKLIAPSGDPIEISCTNFSTGPCSVVSLTIDDGVTKVAKCGRLEEFQVVTHSALVTATVTGLGGRMSCTAKAVSRDRTADIQKSFLYILRW